MVKQIKKMKAIKAAKQLPRATEFERPISFANDDPMIVGDLVSVARGAALILNAAQEHASKDDYEMIGLGLSAALRVAANKVDVKFFQCLGSIVSDGGEIPGITDEVLGYLLQEELAKIRERIHKRARLGEQG
ncbi:MAG: hypothetical protein WB780_11725 [Candidatus Acidiferrales bacterium]